MGAGHAMDGALMGVPRCRVQTMLEAGQLWDDGIGSTGGRILEDEEGDSRGGME